MRTSLIELLLSRLSERTLVTPPAVWGKLPTHGDFVHLRSTLAEQQAWHQWVESVWSPELGRQERRPATQDKGWVHLNAPTSEKPVLPIAFVMPAFTQLPVRNHWFLQGVLMPSCDKVGRPCPLVIYQFAHPNWIQRHWLTESSQRGQTLQYWWARLASLAVTDQMPWAQWVQAFDAVWAAHRPGFRQLIGQAPVTAPTEAMQALLGNAHPKDPMNLYCGVQHFPWLDWPARAIQKPHPKPAFWTQDQQGRYVHAATGLKQLWGQQ